MLGRTFTPGAALVAIEPWRVAILPIVGAEHLRVALSSDRSGCASLAAAMLGIEEDDLDLAMIDDVLRELTNMTAGQLKLHLAADHALGLPRVFDGGELIGPLAVWTHFPLVSDQIHLLVSMSFSAT